MPILTLGEIQAREKKMAVQKEDVWGSGTGDRGMIVARSNEQCPVWSDILPYKSVTVICAAEQEYEVLYWLEHVHGGACVSDVMSLADGRVAMRSNYMCW